MSAQKYSAYYCPRIPYMVLRILSLTASPTTVTTYRIWPCRYSHSLHRLPPSPRIACSLKDTLTHCITYHRLRIPYMVWQILSLTASPNSVPVYRVWSYRHSHSLHRLTLSLHTVYGLADTLTHCTTFAFTSTQSRLRRRRTMRNRG